MYIHNNQLIEDHTGVNLFNRAFQYGDGVFETIKYKNGKALFLNDHFDRLIHSMHMMKLIVPDFFSVDFFADQFKQLTIKNNCKASARIRLQVYRNGGGYYMPDNNQCSYAITASPLDASDYFINELPKKIVAYTDNHKAKTSLSNLKSSGALLYILAAQFAKEQGCDDCFILNEDGNIAETISSNIFIFKNGNLVAPPLSDGGVAGIMRQQIIKIAALQNIACVEKSLTIDDANNADEIILTNVIKGITAVKCNPKVKPALQLFIEVLNADNKVA